MSQPVLYVIAGANGTGKTTATFDLVPPGVPVINSDEIAKQIKIAGGANLNLQELGNREAIYLTNKYIHEYQTFGIETNLTDTNTWKFLIGVKKSGYLLYLIFLCTDDLTILNNRIKERTLRGEHFIRPKIVLERYLNGLQLLKHYLNQPDKITFIDSSDQNVLIAEMQSKKIELKTDKIPAWFKDYFLTIGKENSQEISISAKEVNTNRSSSSSIQKVEKQNLTA